MLTGMRSKLMFAETSLLATTPIMLSASRPPATGSSGTQVGARKTPSKSFTSTPVAIRPPMAKFRDDSALPL
jgi:hypothetical protein